MLLVIYPIERKSLSRDWIAAVGALQTGLAEAVQKQSGEEFPIVFGPCLPLPSIIVQQRLHASRYFASCVDDARSEQRSHHHIGLKVRGKFRGIRRVKQIVVIRRIDVRSGELGHWGGGGRGNAGCWKERMCNVGRNWRNHTNTTKPSDDRHHPTASRAAQSDGI
jgi:hypothetical protein